METAAAFLPLILLIFLPIAYYAWKEYKSPGSVRPANEVRGIDYGHADRTIIKTYKGNQEQATAAFQKDVSEMETQGYYPISQTWVPGSYGCGAFLLALILCFLVIGILIFIYMIIVKPAGTLTVTYELRPLSGHSKESISSEEKTCPKCAEQIKAAAIVCRFCRHSFE